MSTKPQPLAASSSFFPLPSFTPLTYGPCFLIFSYIYFFLLPSPLFRLSLFVGCLFSLSFLTLCDCYNFFALLFILLFQTTSILPLKKKISALFYWNLNKRIIVPEVWSLFFPLSSHFSILLFTGNF